MGRSRRLTYRGALHHVTMRCNNKEFLFEERSFLLFLDVLREARAKFSVHLFNYCLMTNHVHLLFDVPHDDVLPNFMHRVANTFSKRFNTMRQRKGHLWEGRYLSTLVEPQSYFLRCMAYLDLNPVRARMVARPGDYRWSAYRDIAAENESTVTLHKTYLELGNDRASRRRAYSKILEQESDRAPYSLARALFVGGGPFIVRMEKRFGIAAIESARIRRVDVGGAARSVEFCRPHRPRKSERPP
ncbi:MAG: transposase [Planctomycetota bacterium]